ncbi:bacteriophage tail assembly protein [Gottschalkia purinilytica]|uniref:Bacteriophage tail assembly protein n=1 Tax=Gottschalkia purinilytica TaxID=1503 RepID=A0A0L0WAJ8_GOTPU|nr:phage terminase large subunit family protein [Gottschalkia purinilytica]KNF08544.1 bacteriophage tail assembly protein [Gottschalkia purinilytica]
MKKIKIKTLKLFERISKVIAPPPKLTISEWADNYRILSAESSAESGKWSTDRTPYQREIMDAVSYPDTEIVVIKSSAQVGKTEIINNIIAYHIDYDPAPIMMVMPTEGLAKTWSKKRLAPMLRDTPSLRCKVKESKTRDADNTILEKGFPGGYIAMVGANSPTGLSSRPIRILLADEVDRFPTTAGDEGDPLALAEKRTATFWNRKKVFVSTPTIKGISRIAKEYEDTTQEQWCIRCPVCGKFQPYEWSRIKFENVTMECKFCKEELTEYEWKAQPGKWISQLEDQKNLSKKKRGFHLNALASPWERWESIIDAFKDAKKDKEELKTWVNTYLGEEWEDNEGEGADYEVLFKRRETYNCQVTDDVLLLTAGVDVQDDRLEIEVVGWGYGKESWGIQYKKLYGDLEQSHIWNELDKYLDSEFYYSDGTPIKVMCTCIDSGGHFTTEVYRFVKGKENRRIFAIKGQGGTGKPLIGKPSRNNREKVYLFPLGVDTGKESIYARLNLDEEGPGYCHFPFEEDRGYSLDYFKSLCSEKRVLKYQRGVASFRWIQKYKRNEGLDLRNYATAAMQILNPNFEELRKMKGQVDTVTQKSTSTVKKRKKKRIVSKGI